MNHPLVLRLLLLVLQLVQATSQQLMERFEERDQWTEQLEALDECEPLIPGDSLLLAAFLSYSGPFPHRLRRQLLHGHWLGDINLRGVPHSGSFDVKTLLGDERQINWYEKLSAGKLCAQEQHIRQPLMMKWDY